MQELFFRHRQCEATALAFIAEQQLRELLVELDSIDEDGMFTDYSEMVHWNDYSRKMLG